MSDKEGGPLWQLKQQINHYELSGVAFRRDADAYHRKAEEAFAKAEEYRKAVAVLEANAFEGVQT